EVRQGPGGGGGGDADHRPVCRRQEEARPQPAAQDGMKERPGLLARLVARLDRSQHLFLAGLVVAFAVEIVVDWNATFRDVNVLRAGLRDKATHYAAILRLA